MKPSLTTLARRALDEAKIADATVLVATSGGPDSMALLSVLANLAKTRRLHVVAHGVDHGLRPEAGAELDLAEAFARSRGVPFARTRVDVPPGGNVQARARSARWTALIAAARTEGAIVATAHHADDRAETVLLRLFRGAGLRGLAVLPLVATAAGAPDVRIVRPFVNARRADVLAHVDRHAIAFARDPSNDDPRYGRTRVRNDLMPLLAALDPRIVEHLNAVANEAGERHVASDATSWMAGLPRATQEALAALVRSRNREARVWLPDGLVVMVNERKPSKSPTPLLVRRGRGI